MQYDRGDGDGLNSLTTAFIYAGAANLMDSHWPVESFSAAKLTAGMLRHLQSTPAIGMAEAHRRAKVDLTLGPSDAGYAHPFYWASCVIVGCGVLQQF